MVPINLRPMEDAWKLGNRFGLIPLVLPVGIANPIERVYAVRLTSKAHDADGDFIEIGTGAWDGQGRPSWVDIEQLYSVHAEGMRREASALDRARFARVARALRARYGWAVES